MKASRHSVWLMLVAVGAVLWTVDFIDLRNLVHATIYGGGALATHWWINR